MSVNDNIKIGTVQLIFKGVDLGHTKGGATLSHAPEYADLMADQWGTTPLDKALIGEVWTLKARLAEWQLAKLAQAFPMGALAGASNGRLTMGSNAGYRLSENAGQLVAHPRANAATDASDDVVFYNAAPFEQVEVDFTNEDQRIYEVTFIALVDLTKADGSWLGHIGDSTD